MSGIKSKCKDFIVCFLNVLLSNNNKMIYLTTNTILNKWNVEFAKDKNCNFIFHYQRNLKLLRFRQWILFNYHLRSETLKIANVVFRFPILNHIFCFSNLNKGNYRHFLFYFNSAQAFTFFVPQNTLWRRKRRGKQKW